MFLKCGREDITLDPPSPVNFRSNVTATFIAARVPMFLTETDSRPLSKRNSRMTSGCRRPASRSNVSPANLDGLRFFAAIPEIRRQSANLGLRLHRQFRQQQWRLEVPREYRCGQLGTLHSGCQPAASP